MLDQAKQGSTELCRTRRAGEVEVDEREEKVGQRRCVAGRGNDPSHESLIVHHDGNLWNAIPPEIVIFRKELLRKAKPTHTNVRRLLG